MQGLAAWRNVDTVTSGGVSRALRGDAFFDIARRVSSHHLRLFGVHDEYGSQLQSNRTHASSLFHLVRGWVTCLYSLT